MRFLSVASILLYVASAMAFWRLPCEKPVIDARIDPIVSPGKASGHAHTIMGASNIGINATFATLRTSNCTTCQVKDDLSAYWIPELYYEFPNKTYKSVDHNGMLVYYLQRGGTNETITAFPDGFRMLAGDPLSRNETDPSREKGAIVWKCIDYSTTYPETPHMNITNCPDGLRAQVFFPGCWDGVNLDSANHKSHVAYPAKSFNGGQCLSSHPVHLISIFYEVYFSVDPINKLNAGGRFVLANGDPTGYGLHGDFMNGWDKTVLQRAINNCTASSGEIKDCVVFNNEGRLLTDAQMKACTIAPGGNPIPTEKVDGSGLATLPGCVAISEGPGYASPTAYVPGCVPAVAH